MPPGADDGDRAVLEEEGGVRLHLVAVAPAIPHAAVGVQLRQQQGDGGFGHGIIVEPGRVRPTRAASAGQLAHLRQQRVHARKRQLHEAEGFRQAIRQLLGAAGEEQEVRLA